MKLPIICLILSLALTNAVHAADQIRLAVTTSFHNSGLSDVLLPAIRDDLDLEVQLLVVGTGQALKLGESGDVDAILVHSRAAEEAFVAAGFGTHRREIMYNDFVLIGPADDPAGIKEAPTVTAALQAIARAAVPFVSRGDESGTHKKEVGLWAAAEVIPAEAWYRSVGAGMGAALNVAAGLDAYVMSDRASWLNFGNPRGLALLFAGDPVLFNQYAYLPVSPDIHPHVQGELTAKLEDWLISPRAQTLIDGYTIDAEPLFVFNAR